MSRNPLVIVVDSREQLAFTFAGLPAEIIREKLNAGDYGLLGFPGVAVERKTANDLLGCMTASRGRFVCELERLQELDFSAVVVEGSIQELLSGVHSRISPQSVIGTLLAWQQRYPRTHWWFCPSRAWAEKLTFKILDRFHRDTVEGKRLCMDGVAAE